MSRIEQKQTQFQERPPILAVVLICIAAIPVTVAVMAFIFASQQDEPVADCYDEKVAECRRCRQQEAENWIEANKKWWDERDTYQAEISKLKEINYGLSRACLKFCTDHDPETFNCPVICSKEGRE